ncbi:MAG TPA: TrmH family RNA methyltransferase [Trebonia sp.]|jgi:TrmH family RNA methyltransferase|nr:TrmH family RNA methyltransferase [Trebonia sp.]
MGPVESIRDERIAVARSLATRAGRSAAGRCLVEGATLIGQVVAAGAAVEYVLCPEDAGDPGTLAGLAAAGVPAYPVRDGLLRKLTGTGKPADWLAVAELPAESTAADPYGDFAVVCEQVTDPGNLGTIVRTAGALGVRDIVLTDEVTDLFSRRVIGAARGTVLGSRVRRFPDPGSAIASLRERGFQIVATSPRGRHLQSMAPLSGRQVALIVGNETNGACEATLSAADLVVQIPMAGAVESLNVGVAAGIGIYELRMRMIMTMLASRIRGTLGRNMTAAAALGRQALDAHLRQVGDLDSDQAVVLMVLACDRSAPRERLRRDIGVGPEELPALLAPLRERGYVADSAVDTDSPDDADSVTITGEGERAIAALWTIQERVEDGLYAGFTQAERDQLQDLLRRVQDNALRLTRSAGQ